MILYDGDIEELREIISNTEKLFPEKDRLKPREIPQETIREIRSVQPTVEDVLRFKRKEKAET